MRFNTKAKSEAEIRALKIWPNGDYEFKVISIKNHDKNGVLLKGGKDNAFPKYNLTITIWDSSDKTKTVYDDLIDSDDFNWKIRHVFHACGYGKEYDADQHDGEMLAGAMGWLTLGLKPAKDGYEERNIVKDYIVADTSVKPKSTTTDEFNDDIPTF